MVQSRNGHGLVMMKFKKSERFAVKFLQAQKIQNFYSFLLYSESKKNSMRSRNVPEISDENKAIRD